MADEPKKPRKVKDLKARLGKTISPGGGAAAVPPPSVGGVAGPSPAAVPPPTLGRPPGGGVVPPPGVGGTPAPGGVVAPPFAQPPKPKKADPFAAAAPQAVGPQEVRLVIDERPVADAEVGRRARGRVFLVLGLGLAVGLLVGYGAGNMMSDRQLYNLAVRDGKDIYQAVRDASDVVTKAQRFIDTAAGTARGGPGKAPTVDFQAIEALQALEKPLEANAFARKRYNAFEPATVDALFEYYNNVNILWDKFERLANRSLPAQRRAALTESAAAAQNVAVPTGCVFMKVEERFFCGLVYLRVPEESDGTLVKVRSTPTSPQEFDKTLYDGTPEMAALMAETPDNYVALVHPERSMGVLGQQASLFAQYAADLNEIKTLLDRTVEVQGRLEQDLGKIARLEEVFEL
jgi:hypothetical protein